MDQGILKQEQLIVTFLNPQVSKDAFLPLGGSRLPLDRQYAPRFSAQQPGNWDDCRIQRLPVLDLADGFIRFLNEAVDRRPCRSSLKSLRNLLSPRLGIPHAT